MLSDHISRTTSGIGLTIGQTHDFSHHLRSQVLFRVSERPWERGYFEEGKMADGRAWCFVDRSLCSPHFGVTTGLNVSKGNNDVHWFQMVEYMTWAKAGRPAQVEEMIRQLEATRVRESVNLRDMEICPIRPIQPRAGATNGWIWRWVGDHKPWSFSPTNVLGRVVNVCKSAKLWSTLIVNKSLFLLALLMWVMFSGIVWAISDSFHITPWSKAQQGCWQGLIDFCVVRILY